ncbi:hypothetical protein PVT67_16670 [Gallaecimonas kandeliae]|uniref:hypothetical protein n=1 Tax=Gallaecimonas kandeliae TaxID=3029055 RepID=UPI002648DA25|nr:hypothetical protein [Gallaecimonas kandeliae]WKE65277.1 hypothetical protein PVT67_16670 [Gallaecimonas kandeliae]
MHIKKALGLSLAACALLLGSSSLEHKLVPQANLHQEVSWGQWLSGHSGSAQLHFLDLLELISRRGNDHHARQVHP